MMTRSHRLAFVKVLAAVAWADGVIESEERNRIKVLLNRFDLDPDARREVEALLTHPVTFARAVELTKDFAGAIALPGARRELFEELEHLLGSEEERAPEEVELLSHVREILSSHTVVDGLVDRLRGLFSKTLFAGRSESVRSGRHSQFAKNTALQRTATLYRERGGDLEENLPHWNRVTLLGILLAHIAHLDDGWHRGERTFIERELAQRHGLDETAREILLIVMEEERDRDSDLRRVCAEYSRVSTMEDRLAIVDALFSIASADERISKREVDTIRQIADFLWISNPEYLGVRDRYRDRIDP